MGIIPEMNCQLRISKNFTDSKRRSLNRLYQHPVAPMDNLSPDTTNVTADDRFTLPHGFCYCQTKPFPE